MCKGKTAKVYDYYKNDSYITTGTVEEIANELGISKQALWVRHSRTYTAILDGRKFRVKHELDEVRNSVYDYVMLIEGKFIGCGTLAELSEKSGYSKTYITNIANGTYNKNGWKKKQRIEMFKRVE